MKKTERTDGTPDLAIRENRDDQKLFKVYKQKE